MISAPAADSSGRGILRGACAKCKARISVRYPLVELFTGVLSAAVHAGASGYLVKGSEPADIERALRGR